MRLCEVDAELGCWPGQCVNVEECGARGGYMAGSDTGAI